MIHIMQVNGYRHFESQKKHIRQHKINPVATDDILGFPVAQMVQHGASNAKIMGSIPRESKS